MLADDANVGDLVMNVDTREVTRGGEDIALTSTPWELLPLLCLPAGVP